MVYDLTRDNPTRLTSGESYGFVIWTPDSKYLILATPSSGLMWMRTDDSTPPQVLIPSKTPMVPDSITPDGKLAYHDNADPNAQIWTVQLTEEGGQLKAGKPELFLGGEGRSYIQAAFLLTASGPELTQAEGPRPDHTVVFLSKFFR